MSVARVYIGRLSNYARDRDVERFFKGFGRIREVMVKNGYCFVVGVYLVFFSHEFLHPSRKQSLQAYMKETGFVGRAVDYC